jgi:signal transduction histidine kinase
MGTPNYNSSGEFIGYIGHCIDITDRKKEEYQQKQLIDKIKQYNELIEFNLYEKNSLIEELSQAKETLEKLNIEKDKFFSIIAHDLKSPFMGFLGLTQIMAEEFQNLTMAEALEITRDLQGSAKNLYKLLENLLDWTRMQRGSIKFNPELCNLLLLAKQNIEIQTELAKQKDITLINNLTTDFNVIADVSMINTVIRNLISNAIKFTPRGGRVEIGITKSLGLFNFDENCLFVKDNGIGMSQDTLYKLFRIDTKISRPGTENEPSTGLGLILCKEFIDTHSGKIWAESIENVGTTFFIKV